MAADLQLAGFIQFQKHSKTDLADGSDSFHREDAPEEMKLSEFPLNQTILPGVEMVVPAKSLRMGLCPPA